MNDPCYIDSHTHFDITMEDGTITEGSLIADLENNNCRHVVQVSIDTENLVWSRDFAWRNREQGVLFTAGIHPSSPAEEEKLVILENFCGETLSSEKGPLLFGIGECGLDFYRMRQPVKMQEQSFLRQIELARTHHLPLVVHSREAWKETMDILRAHPVDQGIMHCFPGDREAAREALDLGFYLSFAGNVTFKKAVHLQEAASFAPLDRLLLETDAPFLTPVPFRGKPNRPHMVKHTYDFICRLKNITLDELQGAIAANFYALADRSEKGGEV